MRLRDGKYVCAHCGAVLDILADEPPRVTIHAGAIGRTCAYSASTARDPPLRDQQHPVRRASAPRTPRSAAQRRTNAKAGPAAGRPTPSLRPRVPLTCSGGVLRSARTACSSRRVRVGSSARRSDSGPDTGPPGSAARVEVTQHREAEEREQNPVEELHRRKARRSDRRCRDYRTLTRELVCATNQ